jgi:GAF domain-containing protein
LTAALTEAQRELAEARRRESATAAVLNVINRSKVDLDAVLATLTEQARALCGAANATIHMRDGDLMRLRAQAGCSLEFLAWLADNPVKPRSRRGQRTHIGHAALTGEIVEISDVRQAPDIEPSEASALGNYRAVLGVPLTREGRVEGVFSLARPAPGPFPKEQIELVRTFADQAMIAIENARLFNETQEALKRETATSEILRVISQSPTDARPVFDAIVSAAVRSLRCDMATVLLRDGDVYDDIAGATTQGRVKLPPGRRPIDPNANFPSRVFLAKETLYLPDWSQIDLPEHEKIIQAALGVNSALYLPLLREGECIGQLVALGNHANAFGPTEIAQAESFRDQALIAIENARLFDEVQDKTRELEESLAQQTATADVLKVISRSAFDLDAVLKTLTDSARSLSGAATAAVFMRDGEVLRIRAESGFPPALIEYVRDHPIRAGRKTFTGRVALTGEVVHIPDLLADSDYDYGEGPQIGNYRAAIGVPLMRAGQVDGVFGLMRPEAGAFTPRQIEMARAFADQAIIAIENVRLFEEVQAKTRDLEESLQQQTATADVLKVISRSAFDLQAVLHTLVESAGKLCDADGAVITREVDGVLYRAESYGCSDEFMTAIRGFPILPERGTVSGRVLLEGKAILIDDIEADPEYALKTYAKMDKFRTCLGIPMLRDGAPIGVISLLRTKVHAFSDKQIELVQTFADQAVIAIENARLFDEVQAKTRDLEESLERQRATTQILEVIASLPSDATPVFEAIAASAKSVLRGHSATVFLFRDDQVHLVAFTPTSTETDAPLLATFPAGIHEFPIFADVREGGVYQVMDTETAYDGRLARLARARGYRSMLFASLVHQGAAVGFISVTRPEVGAFAAADIAQLRTFADQAVIAIENARLFDEVQAKTRDLEEALQLQTATANVLKTISRSAFDLQAVLTTLAESARELCGASRVTLLVREGDAIRLKAQSGNTPEMITFLDAHPIRAGRETITGRMLLTGEAVHVSDVLADPEYEYGDAPRIGDYRAALSVPLLREGRVEGALTLTRPDPGPFSEREIEMVRAFADQAVIAIENARLFDEVQARTRELAASLQNLRNAQDRLIQSEKLASLGQLTAGIAHEIKNPLNFVNNFSSLSRELLDELRAVLAKAPLGAATRDEADDLIATVAANLDKVVQHGRRADSIVKNMLLHSREGSGERAETNVNAMVEEALNLAYHGARAEKPGFNVTIVKEFDPDAGQADLYRQEITRVLLNLISNGFYATAKRRQAGSEPGYEPTLTASTRNLGDRVEIAIEDNGTGISDHVKEKMFNPFFTTKPAGEGTGLGLSLSHDIVVKQHGGAIDVESEPGSTTFIIRLPRADRALV